MKFERRDLIYFLVLTVAVYMAWEYAISLRLPYLDQIPVFDADVTTANMIMWARGWLHEGIFKIWFATPFNPLSIETPTLESRVLYQSWPSLSVLPIYLWSILSGMEPSATLVNWINTINHGVVALAVAFAAYNLCVINKLNRVLSSLLAIATTFPILLPRGLAYTFGQLYCVTTAIFPFLAICIFLETVFLRASTKKQRSFSSAIFFVVITFSFFVDWSAYTFYAAWFFFRLIGGHLNYLPKWTYRQTIAIASLPFVAFSVYLMWRFGAPGSIARTNGLSASVGLLAEKFGDRINIGGSQISNFWQTFFDMHQYWYSPHVVYLLIASSLLSSIILFVTYKLSSNPDERKNIFITFGMSGLVAVPFYLHMIVFSQHTAIHRWAIAKILFAYAFLPFVILPISLIIAIRLISKQYARSSLIAVYYQSLSVLLGLLFGLFLSQSISTSGDNKLFNFEQNLFDIPVSWVSPYVVYFLVVSALLSGLILFVSFKLDPNPKKHRNIFITIIFSVGFLVAVPSYMYLLVSSQDTTIHRWTIVKTLITHICLPLAIFVVSLVITTRLILRYYPNLNFTAVNYRWLSALSGMLFGLFVIKTAAVSGDTYEKPYLIGRVDKATYLKYDAIYRNTKYTDIVFSPVWEAPPIGMVVGVTNKRIYPTQSFKDIDKIVKRICGLYNVVIVMPDEKITDSFDGQKADKVTKQNGVLFLRFSNYSGPKVGCQA